MCKASADPTNTQVCTYIYAVGGVSIVMTLIIGLLQLITCNMCGCGKYMDAVFTVLGALWWLAAGFITAHQARGADSATPMVGAKEWRTAVVLLSWVTSGLFALLFLVHIGRISTSCCRRRKRGVLGADGELEKAGLASGRPPSAAVELGKEIANRPYMQKGRFGSGKGGKGGDSSSATRGDQQPGGAGAYLSGPNI